MLQALTGNSVIYKDWDSVTASKQAKFCVYVADKEGEVHVGFEEVEVVLTYTDGEITDVTFDASGDADVINDLAQSDTMAKTDITLEQMPSPTALTQGDLLTMQVSLNSGFETEFRIDSLDCRYGIGEVAGTPGDPTQVAITGNNPAADGLTDYEYANKPTVAGGGTVCSGAPAQCHTLQFSTYPKADFFWTSTVGADTITVVCAVTVSPIVATRFLEEGSSEQMEFQVSSDVVVVSSEEDEGPSVPVVAGSVAGATVGVAAVAGVVYAVTTTGVASAAAGTGAAVGSVAVGSGAAAGSGAAGSSAANAATVANAV